MNLFIFIPENVTQPILARPLSDRAQLQIEAEDHQDSQEAAQTDVSFSSLQINERPPANFGETRNGVLRQAKLAASVSEQFSEKFESMKCSK